MASLHELCDIPIPGDYFLSFEDLLEVISDASVKHKFSFKTPHKDLKRARYRCANKNCQWRVNAYRNPENEDEIIIAKVALAHTCIGDALSKRGAVSCQEWVYGFRKEQICGPRGEAAAQAMAEPAGDGNDSIWSPYHCSTCGGRGHVSTTCRRPHQ